MHTLYLTQTSEDENQHQVELVLEDDGQSRQVAKSRFVFALSTPDEEDLRWYLEDYLRYPFDPAPAIAARIEQRIAEIGRELFRHIFESSRDAQHLWYQLQDRLDAVRIEIASDMQGAVAIPWELLRDPITNSPLALRARAFVRRHPYALRIPPRPFDTLGPLRILLVVCRPSGSYDVPFRSVASRLIQGMSQREDFQLDLLRPPTFVQLERILQQAQAAGQPYHIVHFDGHGIYSERDGETGKHGYLVFERETGDGVNLIGGSQLGRLLVETGVPVLILNACRSGYAEIRATPGVSRSALLDDSGGRDPRLRYTLYISEAMLLAYQESSTHASSSLAQEVMEAGLAGVVAMRYNVYVTTAAQFIANLYASLTQGHTLGEAVTLGRKQLAQQPLRDIALASLALQDWPVPIVYEVAPIALFSRPAAVPELPITFHAAHVMPTRSSADLYLPSKPAVGFFGRDDTLLALDRAFGRHSVVLLHAWAGSGKTATAVEFARWYALTGGVEGPVLFTSLKQYRPLSHVLDIIAGTFRPILEQSGIDFLALSDEYRREVALQVLWQIPVLWIWDGVEAVAGFPKPADSPYSREEQRELVGFLRAASTTRAMFLLTSRRQEYDWLGELPARIAVPPMQMIEQMQLARAWAEQHGEQLTDVEEWRPLLRYTQGNPLMLIALMEQALQSRGRITDLVDQLRAGVVAFADEQSQVFSQALFERAFSEEERKQLALLHLFQDFLDVDVVRIMGNPEEPWHLSELRNLTREAAIALLDRAAAVGLLTSCWEGFYALHPALRGLLKDLFDRYYPSDSPAGSPTIQVSRAYVEAIGWLGNRYHRQYDSGHRQVILKLRMEEENLLHAYQVARMYDWWPGVISAMQGLNALWICQGRWSEWARLVEVTVPFFVDPATGGPLPGLTEEWGLIMEYRVRLAREARRWSEAEHMQWLCVEVDRQSATSAFTTLPEGDSTHRSAIRTLATALNQLGEIQREQGKPECVRFYEEALALCDHIEDRPGRAIVAFNLGHAYLHIPALYDLEQAEHYYSLSLELREAYDDLGRARCMSHLGLVAYERFRQAGAARQPEEGRLRLLSGAEQLYQEALALDPPDHPRDLSADHNQLGNIYAEVGDLDRALTYWRESIRYDEMQGDRYAGAQTRHNIAFTLAQAGRLSDALLYAQAALRGLETFGARGQDESEKTRQLVEAIQQSIETGEPCQPDGARPQEEHPRASLIVYTERPSLYDRILAFDRRWTDRLHLGSLTEALEVCSVGLSAEGGEGAEEELSIARIRHLQLALLTGDAARLHRAQAEVVAAGQEPSLAAIGLAVCLVSCWKAGSLLNLQQLEEEFSAHYGPAILRQGYGLCMQELAPFFSFTGDEQIALESVASHHPAAKATEADAQSDAISWVTNVMRAVEILRGDRNRTVVRLLIEAAAPVRRVGGDVPWLALRYLLGMAYCLCGEPEAGIWEFAAVCEHAAPLGFATLQRKAALAVAQRVSDYPLEEKAGLGKISPVDGEVVASDLLLNLHLRYRLGISHGALDTLAACREGFEARLRWMCDLRARLEAAVVGIAPPMERTTHALLTPSLFPEADADARRAGRMLFDQLAPSSALPELQVDTIQSTVYVASLREKARQYRQAAADWRRCTKIQALAGSSPIQIPDDRVPEIEAARLLRLEGELTEALTLLQSVEKTRSVQSAAAQAQLYMEMGIVEVQMENLKEALMTFRDAKRCVDKTENIVLRVSILFQKGRLELRTGNPAYKRTFKEILDQKDIDKYPQLAQIAHVVADVLQKRGDLERS
jgi:tetratricopeptide (TPR) repeat protein